MRCWLNRTAYGSISRAISLSWTIRLYAGWMGKTGIITTIAGMVDGTPCASYLSTNCGDGGPAMAAYFNSPSSITGDAGGNLYVADTYDNAVRKIDANGIITTIAGTIQSPQGFGGDGGPATLAQMSSPTAVSLDGAGNLYVFDSNNDVIREVTAGTSGLSFPAASVGPQGMQVVQVANTSDTPLHVTGLTFPDGFVQQPSGGSNDCTGADTIAPGQGLRDRDCILPGSERIGERRAVYCR